MRDNKNTTNIVNKININLAKAQNARKKTSGMDLAKAEEALRNLEIKDNAYQHHYANPNIFGFNNSTFANPQIIEQQRTAFRQQQEDNLRQQRVSQFQEPDIYRVPSAPQVGRQGLSMARQSQQNIFESSRDFPTRLKEQQTEEGTEETPTEALQRELKTRRKIEVGAKPKGRPVGSRNKPKKFSLRQEEKTN
jgi:hypothetical protein